MKAYYTDTFVLPLPDGHRFPMRKYSRLRERILETDTLPAENLIVPDAATDEQLLRCHTPEYLRKITTGDLTRQEILRIGFPWTPEMVERSRRSSGATICAVRTALREGTSANLAGGTHHAGPDYGSGFSVFNDSAVAARALQAEGLAQKIAVIDCDVHQGNGTAHICRNDPTIFTFSIHGEKNFPFRKEQSDLDIGLPNDTGDKEYLGILEIALERIMATFNPDLVIYQSGADPFVKDKLGKLALSKEGLAARDRLVIGRCRAEGLPVAVSMGGGYAEDIEDIVDIHLQTIRIAAEYAICRA